MMTGMGLSKISIFLFFLAISQSSGYVIPLGKDSLLRAVETILDSPAEYGDLLGLTKVSKDGYDEFYRNAILSLEIGVKYKDSSNKEKGREVDFAMERIRKISRGLSQHVGDNIKLKIDLQPGNSAADFKLTVKYIINGSTKGFTKEGTFTLEQKQKGNDIALVASQNANLDYRTPGFNLDMIYSELEAKGQLFMFGQTFKLKGKRVLGDSLDLIIETGGREIYIHTKLDKAERSMSTTVDFNGMFYHFDVKAKDYSFLDNHIEGSTDFGGDFAFSINTGKESGGIVFSANGDDLFRITYKSKISVVDKTIDFEIKYYIPLVLLSHFQGTIRLNCDGTDPYKMAATLEIISDGKPPITIAFKSNSEARVTRWFVTATSGVNQLYAEKLIFERKTTPEGNLYELKDVINVSKQLQNFVPFGRRKIEEISLEASVLTDKKMPGKIKVSSELKADHQKIGDLSLDTRAIPYVFRVAGKKPKDIMKVIIDHKPGRYIIIGTDKDKMDDILIQRGHLPGRKDGVVSASARRNLMDAILIERKSTNVWRAMVLDGVNDVIHNYLEFDVEEKRKIRASVYENDEWQGGIDIEWQKDGWTNNQFSLKTEYDGMTRKDHVYFGWWWDDTVLNYSISIQQVDGDDVKVVHSKESAVFLSSFIYSLM